MDRMFDEMARILASQMPRRKAFKLLGGALVGGILGTLGATRAYAQTCSPACTGGKQCCQCDPINSICTSNFCVSTTSCCVKGCPAGKHCCTTTTTPFCATNGKTCCGNTKCTSTQKCVKGKCVASS